MKENKNLMGIRFLVIGYDGKIPTSKEIRYDIDWTAKKISGPETHIVFPQFGHRPDFVIHPLGMCDAAETVLGEVTSSKAYLRVQSQVPDELRLYGGRKDFTIEQAKMFLHALLRVQHHDLPNAVAPPYRGVVLLKNGGVKGFSYDN